MPNPTTFPGGIVSGTCQRGATAAVQDRLRHNALQQLSFQT
jgi:hypothetical protein